MNAEQMSLTEENRYVMPGAPATEQAAKVAAADWGQLAAEVDAVGCALTPQVLTPEECREISGLYDSPGLFRSTIDMERYRFGSGQYRYFDRPFPSLVQDLRAAFYPYLLPIARDWAARLGQSAPWPDDFDEWLDMCHRAGQRKPTPILLRYKQNDWNALHRDLYGDLVFPLQVVIGLDRPGADYNGGEFLLVEQRPRAQSRGTVTLLPQGHGLIFTTRDRPVRSSRGWSASPVRHGVSTVRSGLRHTLGLVFHDAS
ncbi:2OG-Fe(II) oxygenase [Nonomuraea rosea]|uniref:2OG-Fe(II) oxygenase n=1 Tax=Nonomuraea rosea TaxID=638574 RepID=A0ABP6ZLH2_9ACTN